MIKAMKAKQEKPLKSVFAKPTQAGIIFADLEATVEAAGAPTVSADAVLRLRGSLNMSRAVFARFLRTNPRTVEG